MMRGELTGKLTEGHNPYAVSGSRQRVKELIQHTAPE